MMNEFFLMISEALFTLTGGVMIMDHMALLLFWVFGMPIISMVPFAIVTSYKFDSAFSFIPTILWTAVMLMITLSVPIYQNELLKDCDYKHAVTITTEEGIVYEDTVAKCNIRDNYYSDEYRVDYR